MAIVLATATVANAGWIKCETIQVLPGFAIQRCEDNYRYGYRNHYRNNVIRWEHKHGDSHNRYAWNYNRYDRHNYNEQRKHHRNSDMHAKPYPRHDYRW